MASSSANHLQKTFEKAARNLQSGNIQDARKGFIKLSKQLPNSAVIWYNLGLCQQHVKNHLKAVEAYQQCLELAPNQVDAWANLGISQKELNDYEKAEASIAKALQFAPGHPRALNLLGSIQAENGETEAARKSFTESLHADSTNMDAKINLANLEFGNGQLDAAEALTNELFLKFPDEFRVKLLRGRLLITQKNYNEASPLIAELEKGHTANEEVLRLSLSFREVIRDHFGAIRFAEKLLDLVPDDAKALNSLGGAYFQLDGIEKSRAYYEKAVAQEPNNAEYENNLGLAWSSLGNKKQAEHHYRQSLKLDPTHAEAYRNIATMKKFRSIEDKDAQAVIQLWNESDDLSDLIRIKLSFALGKIYDDCGMNREAFKVYQIGNDLKFKESRIDLDKYYSHIDTIPRVLTSRPTTTCKTTLEQNPVFVLGMPRSGTTLIEQVLSRHSAVTGCGELPCIEKAITRLEKRAQPMRSYPGDFLGLTEQELSAEAEEYLDWVNRLHNLQTPLFTDKMPFNFAHVWLIKSLFPDASIVHCRRHPLDVITSNYFQLYGSDISFVYNLPALANYYIRYDALMKHWNTLFADEIYNVVYEQFVADNENETRKLIAGAGLDWEDGCLDTGRSDTAVRTASIWQVREGIYTSSTERWRKYETELGEVIAILANADILDEEGNWILN